MKDNWQTPEYILEAVRATLGDDYFDPCPINPTFNGIVIDWPDKNVFINPPYSKGSLKGWSTKALDVFKRSKRPIEYVWLINYGCTDNRKKIKKMATAICDLHKRVSFIDPRTGKPQKGNDRDSVIYYWGVLPGRFKQVFEMHNIGKVYTA